ncbi:MAG: hypothetical protein AAGK32_05720, partial [Actinomycetota bacterium]
DPDDVPDEYARSDLAVACLADIPVGRRMRLAKIATRVLVRHVVGIGRPELDPIQTPLGGECLKPRPLRAVAQQAEREIVAVLEPTGRREC